MENNSPQNPEPHKEQIGSLVERLRSYESDVARLKGIPFSIDTEPKVEVDIPVPPEEDKEKNPLGIAGKLGPSVDANGTAAEAIEASNTFTTDVVKEDPKKAVEELHKETPPVPVARTIQTDIADEAQNKNTSVESIVIAEQNREETVKKSTTDTKISIYFLILSLTLIIGGVITFGVFYVIKTTPNTPAPIVLEAGEVITTDETRNLTLEKDQSIKELLIKTQTEAEKTKPSIIKLSIKQYAADLKPMDSQRFVSLFSQTIPTWFMRSLQPEYLVGMFDAGKGWQPIMIFKLTSYETGYAGMINWEEDMKNDFSAITENSAVNTKNFANPIIKSGFRDVIIKNKDVRVLEDTSGRRVLLYSFPDKETLVITTDQSALEEAFARLNTAKFVR